MSLRRRLVVGFLAVAAVLVGTNVVLYGTFHSFLLDRVDRQLADLAARPLLRGGRPPPQEALTEHYLAVARADGTGVRPVGSSLLDTGRPPPALPAEAILGHAVPRGAPVDPFTAVAEGGDGSWRVAVLATGARGLAVVGVSLDDLDATLDRIRAVQVAATVAVLGALAVVSWWTLRVGVHPLEAMARTADDIAAGGLSRRVEHPDPRTEAGRLGLALNAMLERIQGAFREREASEARVRRFAADASHELRTPLTSVKGYVELWQAGGLRDEAALADAMRRMGQETGRMTALVEDLLLLARLDQQREVDRAPVRLDELAADAVADARAVEPDRPVALDVPGPVVVRGDEAHLRQLLANLVANARVHTPPGTPVHVSVAAVGGVARVVVADEGPGMAPEVAAKVFDRFFRADPARSRAAGGAGLGLSIVAAVAEAHGGRATVESAVGQGSRFVVELAMDGAAGAAARAGS
jgi:two-component system OmpR family sensor kinase